MRNRLQTLTVAGIGTLTVVGIYTFTRISTFTVIAIDFLSAILGKRHEHSEEEMERIDASRQANWDLFTSPSGNELEDHQDAFGDIAYNPHPTNLTEHPFITPSRPIIINSATMYTTFIKDAKLDRADSRRLTSASLILPYLNKAKGVRGCPFGMEGNFSADGTNVRHAHSTGIYNARGKFVYDTFKGIADFAINDPFDGKAIVSRTDVQNYINTLAKTDRRWDNVNVVDSQIGKVAKQGEYDFLFKIIPTRWAIVGDEVVPHAKVTDIKRWLTRTAHMLKERREGRLELPPKPDIHKEESKEVCISIDLYDAAKQLPQPGLFDRFLTYLTNSAKAFLDEAPSTHSADYQIFLMNMKLNKQQATLFSRNNLQQIQSFACNTSHVTVPAISPPPVMGFVGR